MDARRPGVTVTPLQAQDPVSSAAVAGEQTYGAILKSTSLIGAASVITVALSVVRTKAMALLLGPTGVGLLGMYTSIADLTQSLAGLGIQNSGVRQIAEAAGSGDPVRIARTAVVLKHVSVALGAFGAALLIAFSVPISRLTFGSSERAPAIALLSAAVFFRLVSAGQGALIQGMRRVSDMAWLTVTGGFLGVAISVPIIYAFGNAGVVPSLVAVAAASLLTSWWYSRRVPVAAAAPLTAVARGEVSTLLTLGLVFMASAFLTTGAGYAVRLIVLRALGIEAAGLYQSAWALGGLYVGVILQAMGADFYPRLTAVASNNPECNRLVNEQAYVSLLLAGPGVIATLTFAPLVLALFYSPEFAAAVGLLRWICLGMLLRVIAWPMGFIVVAKGARATFFWTEVAATAVHVSLAWWLVNQIGLNGSGAAFFGLYVWHGVLIYLVVRRLSGFRWSAANIRVGLFFLPMTGLVFVSFLAVPLGVAVGIGSLSVVLSTVYAARALLGCVPADRVPHMIRYPLERLRLMRSA